MNPALVDSLKRVLARTLAAGVCLGLLHPAPAWAESTRQARPLTLSVTGNAILPSVGLEVAGQASDRVAFAAQVTQLLIAHVDVSLRMRVFVVAGDESGFYVGPIVHAWYSPLIFHGINPVGTIEAGWEHRARTGFTFGAGIGGGVLWNRHRDESEGGKREWEPVGMFNLRFGKSW